VSGYDIRLVRNESDLPAFLDWLAQHPGRLALDTETDNAKHVFNPGFGCHIVSVGASDGSGWSVSGADRRLARRVITETFQGTRRRVWAHNANYDAWVIRKTLGLKLESLRCTLLGARVAHPGLKSHGLKELRPETQSTLDALQAAWELHTGSSVRGAGKDWLARAVSELPLATPALLAYATVDAIECARLADDLAALDWARPHILREVKVDQMWRWTGYDGIRVDAPDLQRQIGDIEGALAAAEERLGFVPAPAGNAVHTFVARLGVELPLTPNGAPSLAQPARRVAVVPEESIDDWHYFCDILEIQASGAKLREIYSHVDINGRVHPKINTAKAITGRSSVTEPAMQNLRSAKDPKNHPAAYALNPGLLRSQRHVLMAEPGNILVGCDLSHVEPSLLAVATGDPGLVRAVGRDKDIYVEIAAKVWGATARDVDEQGKRTPAAEKHRSAAKVVLLSLMYGKGDKMLANDLRLPIKDAAKLKRQILDSYPTMKKWIERQKKLVEWGGTPQTLSGRRLFGDTGKPYTAVNYIIQGTASDVFKDFCIAVGDRLPRGARPFLPVHDEIVIECPPEQAETVMTILAEEMYVEMDGVEIWGEPALLGEHWGKA
jgi:DNA polymerase-1